MSKGPRLNPSPLVTCPHCALPADVSCCVCHRMKRIAVDEMLRYARNIWARKGCDCGACLAIGPMPGRDLDVPPAVVPGQVVTAPAVGPFETFREAFAIRNNEP